MKIIIQNLAIKENTIILEPTGEIEVLKSTQSLTLNINQQNSNAVIHISIYNDNHIIIEENNDVFIDKEI